MTVQALDRIRPGPGRPCTICEHPDREAIDDDLVVGVRYRTIANRYGIASHVNVIRHAQSHLRADGPPQDVTDPKRIKARLLELDNRLHRWLDSFEEAQAPTEALKAASEIRKVLELSARLGGQLDQQIVVLDRAQGDRLLRVLYRCEAEEVELLESLGASPELVAGFRAGRPGVVRGAFIETTAAEQ